MAVFLRTRASVRDIVIPRYVVSATASSASFAAGMVVAYVLTGILLDWPDLIAVTIGAILFGLYLAFAVAVVALVASFIRRVTAVAILSVGILIVVALLGLVPQIAPWLPSDLVGATDELVRGVDFDFWRAVAMTIALSIVFW